MTTKTHLLIPDPHAHFEGSNERAIWAGKLIADIKPDIVLVGGDVADMPSLSSYDKGKKEFHGRSYAKDIGAHADFQDRLWSTVRASKKRLPYRIALIGNHEQRIQRAISSSPELEGTIGSDDLNLRHWYDEIVPYEGSTPGVIELDGVLYSHYFVGGVMGRPLGGEHPAYSLVTKKLTSCTAFHTHIVDYCVRTKPNGQKIMGMVAGCFTDGGKSSEWAGQAKELWWNGIIVKRNVAGGCYDPQWISIDALRKEYGTN